MSEPRPTSQLVKTHGWVMLSPDQISRIAQLTMCSWEIINDFCFKLLSLSVVYCTAKANWYYALLSCYKILFTFFPLFWYLCSALVCHFQPFQEPFWGQSQARALAGLGSWEIPSKLNCRNIWCLHRVFPNNQTDSLLLYLTSSLTVLGHFY